MDVERAIAFVRTHGSQFERARLSRTLGEDFDSGQVIRGFSSIQNPDGGFPFGDMPGLPSCLSNTAMALDTLAELGLSGSEPAAKAVRFFEARMTTNGTWSENDKIRPLGPPRWDMPGDPQTRIWLTADVADVLFIAGRKAPGRTAAFLRKHQMEDGRFDGYEHTTWISLSLFGKLGFGQPDVQTRALKYLEKADIGDWDASCIAWCMRSMRRGGIGSSSPLWGRLMALLSETQEEDGAWPGEGGEQHRVRDANSVLAAALEH